MRTIAGSSEGAVAWKDIVIGIQAALILILLILGVVLIRREKACPKLFKQQQKSEDDTRQYDDPSEVIGERAASGTQQSGEGFYMQLQTRNTENTSETESTLPQHASITPQTNTAYEDEQERNYQPLQPRPTYTSLQPPQPGSQDTTTTGDRLPNTGRSEEGIYDNEIRGLRL